MRRAPPSPNVRSPSSSETSTKSSPSAARRATTASSAAWSMAVVSSPPTPSRRTGSRSTRVGSRSKDDADVLDAEAAGLEPVRHGVTGWKRRPESGFGKKYVLFGGMGSPRRATAKTSSTRGRRRMNAASAAPLSTSARASSSARRVADSVEAVAVDELDVELALAPWTMPTEPAPIPDRRRALVRLVLEPRERLLEARGTRSSSAPLATIRAIREDAMCGKELQARRRPSARREP